jgi:hypothetical protein
MRVVLWFARISLNVIAAGCLWGFYTALHNPGELDAAARNTPWLAFIVFLAVGSWFVRESDI